LTVLEDVDQATQRARRIGLEQQERVRLGIVRTASKYPFAHRALSAFKASRPSATVELTRAASPELVESLHHGQLDLALLYERQLDTRAFAQRIIHLERYVLAIHPRHPLATRPSLHLGDLAGEPLVWLSRRNNADNHDALLQHCRLHGLEPVIAYEADSHDEQMELVTISAGLSLTSASTQLTTPPEQLVFRAISGFQLELQLSLAWQKGLVEQPAAGLLADMVAAIDEHQSEIAAGKAAWSRMPNGEIVARCPTGADS
jgi:DNA-binding transcriptional LysR family regulator